MQGKADLLDWLPLGAIVLVFMVFAYFFLKTTR